MSLGTGEQEDIRMDRGGIKIHRHVKEERNLGLSKIFFFFNFKDRDLRPLFLRL